MNSIDTTDDARRVIYDLYRRMSTADKARRLFEACRTGQILAFAGIRRLNPSATKTQIWRIWAKRHLGNGLFKKVYRTQNDE